MLYSLRVPHFLAKRELKAKEIDGTGKVEEFASESKSVETFYKRVKQYQLKKQKRFIKVSSKKAVLRQDLLRLTTGLFKVKIFMTFV